MINYKKLIIIAVTFLLLGLLVSFYMQRNKNHNIKLEGPMTPDPNAVIYPCTDNKCA